MFDVGACHTLFLPAFMNADESFLGHCPECGGDIKMKTT